MLMPQHDDHREIIYGDRLWRDRVLAYVSKPSSTLSNGTRRENKKIFDVIYQPECIGVVIVNPKVITVVYEVCVVKIGI